MSQETVSIKSVEKVTISGYISCDGCSARSKFYVHFPFGNLAFCAHHYKKNESLIFTVATKILVEEGDSHSS